jgi:hypothetical protein
MESKRRELRLVIDTGGPDLMLFQSRLPNSMGFQILGTENVRDASGGFQRRRAYLGKEKIGSQLRLSSMTGEMKETILTAFWACGGLSSGKLPSI